MIKYAFFSFLTFFPLLAAEPVKGKTALATYCEEMDKKFELYGWEKGECQKYNWNHVRSSAEGRPIVWTVFGEEKEKVSQNTTLVLCGVHGDEITPIKFCFDLLSELNTSKEEHKDELVIIAPVVNPDSFFKPKPTRTNSHGVDVNRNFPTTDWSKDALRVWGKKFGKDSRRYPGKGPGSEQETIFQMNLVKRYRPNKIISVHAPLTLLDYDGPEDDSEVKKSETAILANQLLISMSEKASGYRIKKYPYFIGSLGKWAGKERNVPVYTLELPTTDSRKSAEYWKLFRGAIHQALKQDLRPSNEVAQKAEGKGAK